jgi:hypothetical protein
MAALWDHFIDNYGDAQRIDAVPWSMGVGIFSI